MNLSKKDGKELAKAILEKKGVKYDEWQHEQHIEVIVSNMSMVKDALVPKEKKTEAVEESKQQVSPEMKTDYRKEGNY